VTDKNLPITATLSTRNPTCIGLRSDRLVTNCLSHVIAIMSLQTYTSIMKLYVFCYHCFQTQGQHACLHMIVREKSNPYSVASRCNSATMPENVHVFVRSVAKRICSKKRTTRVKVLCRCMVLQSLLTSKSYCWCNIVTNSCIFLRLCPNSFPKNRR
jgi:hypothetical protein